MRRPAQIECSAVWWRIVTVSIVFEVHATEDEPVHAILQEIQSLPVWERELMTARIMRWEADRRTEEAAGARAVQEAEDRRQARIRETRERNRLTREPSVQEPEHMNGGVK